jgi:hypothetical protein
MDYMNLARDLIVDMSTTFAFCIFAICAMTTALCITRAMRRTALHARNLNHEIEKIKAYKDTRMIEGRRGD